MGKESMLRKITIKNFKCFKNQTVIDMKQTNYKLLEQNTHGGLLKGALFVGDNASGKTTAILPLKLLLDLLFKNEEVYLSHYQCVFSEDQTTSLKFEFLIDEHTIIYQFSFSGDSFLDEQLTVDGQLIIKRIKKDGKLILENETLLYNVDESLLFLRQVYFNTKFSGNKVLATWFDYLKKSIYINSYFRTISTYDGENLLINKYIESHSLEKINQFFEYNHFDYQIQYTQVLEKKNIHFELEKEEEKMIFFKRMGIDVPIPLFMESMGNQTLINILPAIISAVERGGLLIIDEFSSGLHNKLEELLVKYMMQYSSTTQLFFVSHSTNLLSNTLLRPDQIFSVEMMSNEGSVLYRFSDEQPRVAQNLEKMYLSGVFGGIPEYGIDKE